MLGNYGFTVIGCFTMGFGMSLLINGVGKHIPEDWFYAQSVMVSVVLGVCLIIWNSGIGVRLTGR